MTEEDLVDRFFQLAVASADVFDFAFEHSTETLLQQKIRAGVHRLVQSKKDITYQDIANAQTNLLRLVLAMVAEFDEQQHGKIHSINESIMVKGWDKRCPGCPPWC